MFGTVIPLILQIHTLSHTNGHDFKSFRITMKSDSYILLAEVIIVVFFGKQILSVFQERRKSSSSLIHHRQVFEIVHTSLLVFVIRLLREIGKTQIMSSNLVDHAPLHERLFVDFQIDQLAELGDVEPAPEQAYLLIIRGGLDILLGEYMNKDDMWDELVDV